MSKKTFDIKDKITELFEYTLDNNSKLYRGLHDVKEYDQNYNKISWFSLDKQTVYKYAKDSNGIICSFIPKKKDIKLLNITSSFFRMHLLDQVNMNYKNEDKIPVFSAIGIPNLELVKYVINKYFKEKPIDACKENDLETKLFAEYLGGHRLSEIKVDEIFAETLESIYKNKFDGYISTLNWSSCHHKNFPPEICLFKPKQVLNFVKQVKYIPSKLEGGSKLKKEEDNNEFVPAWDSHAYSKETTEEYNERKKIELLKYKWNKPLEYDEDGMIKWPNHIEFSKFIFDQKFDKVTKEELKMIRDREKKEKRKNM
jgi:hypothetical protein